MYCYFYWNIYVGMWNILCFNGTDISVLIVILPYYWSFSLLIQSISMTQLLWCFTFISLIYTILWFPPDAHFQLSIVSSFMILCFHWSIACLAFTYILPIVVAWYCHSSLWTIYCSFFLSLPCLLLSYHYNHLLFTIFGVFIPLFTVRSMVNILIGWSNFFGEYGFLATIWFSHQCARELAENENKFSQYQGLQTYYAVKSWHTDLGTFKCNIPCVSPI